VLAALFVLLATSALAVARYTRTPPVYLAAQSVAIVVAPPNSSTTLSSYSQRINVQQAEQIAQLITTPAFLRSSAFEGDVTTRLQRLPGDTTTRAATSAQVGAALSAQLSGGNGQGNVSGSQITLTARWATTVGAQDALAAATAALQNDATQLLPAIVAAAGVSGQAPTIASGAGPTPDAGSGATNAAITPSLTPGALIVAQAVGAPSTAVRDPAALSAARTRLYEQLALAVVAALLLGAALQWALVRRPRVTVSGAHAGAHI